MFRSLTSVLHSLSKQNKLKKYFIYDQIKQIWNDKIDKQIKQNTEIINYNNYVVIIKTTTPTILIVLYCLFKYAFAPI